MYVVIFKATINELDGRYSSIAKQLRKLALEKYGCVEFNSVTEGKQEIAISYWPALDNIRRWKQAPEHLLAQERGKNRYYASYQVQIVEVLREYSG